MTLCICSRRYCQYKKKKNYRAAIDLFLYEHRTWTLNMHHKVYLVLSISYIQRSSFAYWRSTHFRFLLDNKRTVKFSSIFFFSCTTTFVPFYLYRAGRVDFAAFFDSEQRRKYGKSTATEVSGANVETVYKCLLLFIYYPPHSFVHFPFFLLILPQRLMPIFILFLT